MTRPKTILRVIALPWRLLARQFRAPQVRDLALFLAIGAVMLVGSVIAMWLLAGVANAAPLTAGDRVQVLVEAGEEFSGKYQLDTAGRIQLPYAGAIAVGGVELERAAVLIGDRLVSAGLFKRGFVRVSVSVLTWAPIDVRVSGAVFYPGVHRVNVPLSRDRGGERLDELPGAAILDRKLSDALRAAGGVTPWADVEHIAIRRRGHTRLHSLWHIVQGVQGDDPMLESGDEVLVANRDTQQPELARPSAITPPGIKVFVSNVTTPVNNNNAATASGGSISLAYGARLSQAVVAANCAGGMLATSGTRSAILVRTDRTAGTTAHWEVPVETLIREAREEINPVLLEGDALACYDSTVTTVRDVFRAVADIFLPFSLLRRGRP